MSLLGSIQEMFEQAGYDSIFIPASPKIFLPRVLLLMGVDSQEREQKLEITESIQPANYMNPTAEKLNSLPCQLQFMLTFPFQVEDLSLTEVSALLHYINRSTNFPGFELDELEGKVFYRYVWVTQPDYLAEDLLKNILQTITLNLSLFSDLIERVAVGAVTFNDLLSEIIKKFEKDIKD